MEVKALKKIGRFLWILLAVGCLVLVARYCGDIGRPTTKEAVVILSLAVLFWFFLILAIGGKKGVPFAFGVATFAGCSLGFLCFVNWLPNLYGCDSSDLHTFKACTERVFQNEPYKGYVFFAAVALALLVVPFATAFVGRGVYGIMNRPKTVSAPTPTPVLPSGGKPRRLPRGRRGVGAAP